MEAMQTLHVPYTEEEVSDAVSSMESQADKINQALEAEGIMGMKDKEIVALIAYLQRMGKTYNMDVVNKQ
jgi:cytochrome c oxidase cbb3-type subunit I/II